MTTTMTAVDDDDHENFSLICLSSRNSLFYFLSQSLIRSQSLVVRFPYIYIYVYLYRYIRLAHIYKSLDHFWVLSCWTQRNNLYSFYPQPQHRRDSLFPIICPGDIIDRRRRRPTTKRRCTTRTYFGRTGITAAALYERARP